MSKWLYTIPLIFSIITLSLLDINFVKCDEETYKITVLSFNQANNSHEILGATYDKEVKDVEWVALYANVDGHFKNETFEKHEIILYNVKNNTHIKLNRVYKDIRNFEMFNNDETKGIEIFLREDDNIHRHYKLENNSLTIKSHTVNCSYAVLNREKDTFECVENIPQDCQFHKFFGVDGDTLYLYDEKKICIHKNGQSNDTLFYKNLFIRERNIIILNGKGYKCLNCECNEEDKELYKDVACINNEWIYPSDQQNPFEGMDIKESRGFNKAISIFSSEYGSIIAVPEGKYNCETPSDDTDDSEPPSDDTDDSEPPSEDTDDSEPPKEDESSNTPKEETKEPSTPKNPERSATTWAIIVIVLIVLSGLAYIAWRYFRGGQNTNIPFLGENS